MKHTLWIPIIFPSLNALIEARRISKGRWNKYTDIKKRLGEQIQTIARLGGFGPVTDPAYYTYLHFEQNRQRDPSNFASSVQKLVEDGLQGKSIEEGVAFIPGDGWKHVLGFQHWWNLSKDSPGVFLIAADRLFTHEEALQIFRSRLNRA